MAIDEDLTSDLYAIDINGTNVRRLRRLIGVQSTPAFDRTSDLVVFRSSTDLLGRSTISVMHADGTGLHTLAVGTHFLGDDVFMPSFTSDGKHVVFTEVGFTTSFGTWLIRPDGAGKPELLLHDAYFTRFNSDDSIVVTFGVDDDELALLRLSDHQYTIIRDFKDIENPFFHPTDPTIIVFFGRRRTAPEESGIFTFHIDDRSSTLIHSSTASFDPVFGPNGDFIVFSDADHVTGQFQLFKIDANGSHLTKLTNFANASARQPTVSPEGTYIVFAMVLANEVEMFKGRLKLIRVDTRDTTKRSEGVLLGDKSFRIPIL